jgi:hypothetical protein
MQIDEPLCHRGGFDFFVSHQMSDIRDAIDAADESYSCLSSPDNLAMFSPKQGERASSFNSELKEPRLSKKSSLAGGHDYKVS